MCARKNRNAEGLFLYDARDITPDAILFEIEHEGLACGPMGWTNIYVCADLMKLRQTCETVLKDFFACGLLDDASYAECVLYENSPEKKKRMTTRPVSYKVLKDIADKERVRTGNRDDAAIISNWLGQIGNRIEKIRASGRITKHQLKKIREVVIDYSLGEKVGMVCLLKDYLRDKASHDFLLRQFEDENGNPTIKRLAITSDARLIAKAINNVNQGPF